MTVLKLIFKEIAHRKIIFVLSMVAVVVAVAFYVLFSTADTAANRETTRLMRDIGFNIRIIPKQTDMGVFYLQGFSDETMPEDYVDVFATQKDIGYNHLVATLNGKTKYNEQSIIIRGLAPEICPPGKAKSPMVFSIEKGTVFVGSEAAKNFNLQKGSSISLADVELTVAKVLSESGSADDITLQCHLEDAQAILGEPARINEIKAIDCLCFVPTEDPLIILRQQLAELLPEGKVVQMQAIAKARSQQRRLIKNVFAMIMPIVIIVCGLWIGILAMTNVRQRQEEIGLARALGYGTPTIITLFFGRAVITGLIGAVIGFSIGTLLALQFGPSIFTVTAKAIQADFDLLYLSLIAAPAFAAISSFIPVMIAVTQDPAITLRHQ